MALLAGLIASEIRGSRDRGVIAEVVTEAKNAIEEITSNPPDESAEPSKASPAPRAT
jgi:hypothetical protein